MIIVRINISLYSHRERSKELRRVYGSKAIHGPHVDSQLRSGLSIYDVWLLGAKLRVKHVLFDGLCDNATRESLAKAAILF